MPKEVTTEEKKRTRAPKELELAGMPDGKVPKHIRERAEDLVRLSIDIDKMKEDQKDETEKLMDEMTKGNVPVVVVVYSKWKYRIRMKPGKTKLTIEDVGIDSAETPIVTAPKEHVDA